ncbi:MAG: 2Fe-2S iron-sulfur cluster-binding protein [Cruoricaptor ignavus]|nr:2Fe-2S iron-sulfur cluster-binding protein [Cruoricaptor ignavus]
MLTPYGFDVKFITPDGEYQIRITEDTYILDAAEMYGLDLPYSDRAGASSTCVALLVSGEVDNTLQRFLKDSQLDAGYRLLCVGYALRDCTLLTHQEENMPSY